mmetsp:Transcript_2299/g.3062  ORF Transcript_2299/g.3062 Transcript_2299/m.3062 type:complete len:325 (+) Transcript_2299:3012-3986(+)
MWKEYLVFAVFVWPRIVSGQDGFWFEEEGTFYDLRDIEWFDEMSGGILDECPCRVELETICPDKESEDKLTSLYERRLCLVRASEDLSTACRLYLEESPSLVEKCAYSLNSGDQIMIYNNQFLVDDEANDLRSVFDHMIDLSLALLSPFLKVSSPCDNNFNREIIQQENNVFFDNMGFEDDDYQDRWDLEETSTSIFTFSLGHNEDEAPIDSVASPSIPISTIKIKTDDDMDYYYYYYDDVDYDILPKQTKTSSAKLQDDTNIARTQKKKHSVHFYIALALLVFLIFCIFIVIYTLIFYLIRKCKQHHERMIFKRNFQPLLLEV